jgi:ATP-dependent helicase/nuclease subunit A
MSLTDSQLKAIESDGNILVSAGAGSGKTTVLTNRVIDKIIHKNIDISDFLIVTFTNAAAKEMRTRIKSALIKNKLDYLVNKVDSAHIETFDAFSLYVVKKYGYLIGLPFTINNVPDDVIQVKKYNIIKEIFDEYYREKNPLFFELINTYCIKDDSNLMDFVYKFYSVYNAKDNKEEYLSTYVNKYLKTEDLVKKPDEYFRLIKKDLSNLNDLINSLSTQNLRDKFNEYYKPVFNANTYEELCLAFNSLDKAPRTINAEPMDGYLKDQIRKFKNYYINDYLSFNKETYLNQDIPNEQKFIPFIIEIIKKLSVRLNEFERSTGYFTFSDVANYAYYLVKNFSVVRTELKQKIKLIFIDEYQDTNDLQNNFIDLISDNNVFAVGDVKQSIYLFRNANPQHFTNLYETYKHENKVIDMNENFRSRKEVVNKVNEIFNPIMTLKFGGAEYRVSHNLIAKNDAYEKDGKIEGQHGIVAQYFDKKFNIDDVILDIKKRIASHQLIYDREEKCVREVTFKDFAILSPVSTKFITYEKAFQNANLPITAVYDETLFDDNSVLVMLSLLNAIKLLEKDNRDQNDETNLKHAYISIVRSFLFNYDDSKIFNLVNNNAYKVDPIYIKLVDFARAHQNSLLEEIYLDLVKDFDFIGGSSNLLNPLNSIEKINLFFERIKIMDDLNYTLDDFISYLADLNTLKITMESRHDEESNNTITLTTIHKSKGLQYKIVYLVDLKNTGKTDSEKCLFDKDYGCWLQSFAFPSTISIEKYIDSFNDSNRKREEKMRFLYVALTRTEDTCILCLEKDAKEITKAVENCNCLFDYLKASKVVFEENSYAKMEFIPSIDSAIPQKQNQAVRFDELNLDLTKSIIKDNASKDLNLDVDVSKLNYGTHMHLLMEEVDFINKDTSFIKDETERNRINKVLSNSLFSKINEAKIFKEYQFIDEKNAKNGVIDLLLIYQDKAVIVDYKLKHIEDEAYKKQLEVYKNFVESKFKLSSSCYLLSLIDDEVKEVF